MQMKKFFKPINLTTMVLSSSLILSTFSMSAVTLASVSEVDLVKDFTALDASDKNDK